MKKEPNQPTQRNHSVYEDSTPLKWQVNLHINTFARRQTEESRFSHFTGTDEKLLEAVAINWPRRTEGYREGVILVPVPPAATFHSDGSRDIFYSGVVQLEEGDHLYGSYEPRKKGETPRKTVSVESDRPTKIPAKSVEIVLYASELLAEDGDNERPAEVGNWEIISINASPEIEPTPITPTTLMHNHFRQEGDVGATESNLSNEEFVKLLEKSFLYWRDKTMIGVR